MKKILVLCTEKEVLTDFETPDRLSQLRQSGFKILTIEMANYKTIREVFPEIKEIRPDFVILSTGFEEINLALLRVDLESLAIRSSRCHFDILFSGENPAPSFDISMGGITNGDMYSRYISGHTAIAA
jgi:hypothetical protein